MPDPASWDLLDEAFDNLNDWGDVDSGNGVSEISPAGQLRLDGNAAIGGATRNQTITDFPLTLTLEYKLYCDKVGTLANGDSARFMLCGPVAYGEDLYTVFNSDGLCIYNGSDYIEVGTNTVKTGGSAEWQIWRFLVNFTTNRVDVYLTDTTHSAAKVGDELTIGNATGAKDLVQLTTHSTVEDDILSHVDYIKIATGLYAPTQIEAVAGIALANIEAVAGIARANIEAVAGKTI